MWSAWDWEGVRLGGRRDWGSDRWVDMKWGSRVRSWLPGMRSLLCFEEDWLIGRVDFDFGLVGGDFE